MSTTSSNMNLVISTIGVDSGLLWEQNLNASLLTIDAHNHTPGSGVQIPSTGLDINADLPFGGFAATGLSSTVFTAQGSLATLSALYTIGNNLYFNDGVGNVIQMTLGGAVNATSSGITSGTASAAFVGSVLVVNADTNKPANIQVASVLLGNNVTSSNYLTLSPPNAMAGNYGLTLPSIPGATKIMSLDTSGNMSGNVDADGTSLQFTSLTLAIKNLGVTTAKLAANAVTIAKIDQTSAFPKLKSQDFTSSGSFSVGANVTQVWLWGAGGGGGGGGGGGAGAGGGGSGGSSSMPVLAVCGVTASSSVTVTIGAAGTGGAGGTSGNDGHLGVDGGNTIFASPSPVTFYGGDGGDQGRTAGVGGTATASTFYVNKGGGGGDGTGADGSNGKPAFQALGGAKGLGAGGAGGGGGGGGAAGFDVGGAGGNGGNSGGALTPGAAAAANSSAGGGGGGGASSANGGAAGGTGGSGFLRVLWIDWG